MEKAHPSLAAHEDLETIASHSHKPRLMPAYGIGCLSFLP